MPNCYETLRHQGRKAARVAERKVAWRFIARCDSRKIRRVATTGNNGKHLHFVALSRRLQHEESSTISDRVNSRAPIRVSQWCCAQKRNERFRNRRCGRSCSLAPFDPRISCCIETVQLLKGDWSHWLKETFPTLNDFAWQDGYAAFTVSQSQLDDIRAYVRSQREHHRTKTFAEEYRAFWSGIIFNTMNIICWVNFGRRYATPLLLSLSWR